MMSGKLATIPAGKKIPNFSGWMFYIFMQCSKTGYIQLNINTRQKATIIPRPALPEKATYWRMADNLPFLI